MIRAYINATTKAVTRAVIPGSGLNFWVCTLEKVGDGSGVSTLRLWVMKDITLTLTDAARFYDDAAGTTNEGTSRTVVAGAMRTFYLKCPSGTASLVFSDVRKLVRWGDDAGAGWVSSTNAASIAGSIEGLTNITYLRVQGSNTLSGSVAGLTKLTYLRVEGSNTISGSVAGLTKLTVLYVSGSNTLSGSVVGLTDLTHLIVYGSNTLSGSVAGLTKLTYLYVGGFNTISGDIGGSGTSAMVNGITLINIQGNNQLVDYTSGAIWSLTDNCTINPATGYGYSATEIDNILIDMAASLGNVSDKTITLKGSSDARTSASDAAVTTLNGKGWSVVTN